MGGPKGVHKRILQNKQLYYHDCMGPKSQVTPQGTTGRVGTGDQKYPALCHCQLGQDIPLQMQNWSFSESDWHSRLVLYPISEEILSKMKITQAVAYNIPEITRLGPDWGTESLNQ